MSHLTWTATAVRNVESFVSANTEQDGGSQATTRISARKLEANRNNAKKSTGPKTPEGKRISGRNAITHGIFHQGLLPDEDLDSYERLRDALYEVYPAQDVVDQIELDHLVQAEFKRRRLIRAELTATLRERACTQSARRIPTEDSRRALMNSTVGLRRLRDGLQLAKAELGRQNLSEESARMISLYFGPRTDRGAAVCFEIAAERDDTEYFETDPSAVGRARAEITAALTRLERREKALRRRERQRAHAEAAGIALPPLDVLERLERYARANRRDFYRVVDRLRARHAKHGQ